MKRRPILRFVLLVWAGLLAFQALFVSAIARSSWFAAYLEAIARSTRSALGIVGYDIEPAVRSVVIGSQGFEIAAGCDGLQPAAFVAIAIAASPAPLRARALGAVLGVGAIVLLNLVRVSSLVVTLVEAPSVFQTVHEAIWPMAIMVFAIASWAAWASHAIPTSRWAR